MNGSDTTRLWSELIDWYRDHLPELLDTLSSGIDEQALDAFDEELQGEIGRGFPQAFRDIYLQNDGREICALCGVFFGLSFMSLSEAHYVWQGLRDYARQDPTITTDPEGEVYPPNAIRPEYVNNGRVPFAHDGSGSYLAVDLLPGPEGQIGQVINFADTFEKYVVAPSLDAFLVWLLSQYHAGNYRIVTHNIDGEAERNIQIHEPSREDFLDAVPLLFGS